MEFTIKQFLGWTLVIIGLVMVFWDISTTYFYFSGDQEFPQLFMKQQPIAETAVTTGSTLQDQMMVMVKDQIKQMIPENSATELLNISTWMIFASFMLWAGSKVVGMGTDFLKNDQRENNRI